MNLLFPFAIDKAWIIWIALIFFLIIIIISIIVGVKGKKSLEAGSKSNSSNSSAENEKLYKQIRLNASSQYMSVRRAKKAPKVEQNKRIKPDKD